MSETLEARVERLEKMIARMQPKQEQWVGATVVTKEMGWDQEDLRRARRNGGVKYKIKRHGSKKNTYVYLLSSILKTA